MISDAYIESADGRQILHLEFGLEAVRLWPIGGSNRSPVYHAPVIVRRALLQGLVTGNNDSVPARSKGGSLQLERVEDDIVFTVGKSKFVFPMADIQSECAGWTRAIGPKLSNVSQSHYPCSVNGAPNCIVSPHLDESGIGFFVKQAQTGSDWEYLGWHGVDALDVLVYHGVPTVHMFAMSAARINLDRQNGTAHLSSFESDLRCEMALGDLEDIVRKSRTVAFALDD